MAKIIINGKTEYDDTNDMPVKNTYSNSFNSSSNDEKPFNPINKPRLHSRAWLGVGITLFIIVIFGLSFLPFLPMLSGLFGGSGLGMDQTYALKGDPTHFDPIASLNEVRATFDPTAQLSSLDMTGVRPDGTIDITASYKPTATYDFYHEVPLPKDAPPVGAGGNTSGKWYEDVTATVYTPGQWNHVTSMGGNVSLDYSYANKGIDVEKGDQTGDPGTLLPDPKCSMKDLWAAALKNGASQNAVADITYDDSGYSFTISGADNFTSLQFDDNCQLPASS